MEIIIVAYPQIPKGDYIVWRMAKWSKSLFIHPFPQKIYYFSQHGSWAISLKSLSEQRLKSPLRRLEEGGSLQVLM